MWKSPGTRPLLNSNCHHVCQLWNAYGIRGTHPFMTSMRPEVTLSMRQVPTGARLESGGLQGPHLEWHGLRPPMAHARKDAKGGV